MKEVQEKLLNEENGWSGELNVEKMMNIEKSLAYVRAVLEALNLMKTRKAVKPSSMTSELLKVCKNDNKKKLEEVAYNLLKKKRGLKFGEVN